MCVSLSLCVCVCVCVCVCAAGLSGLLSLIKVLFVFPLIGNTLGLGRALPGLGSGVWGRPGVLFSGGLSSGPSSFSPQKSRLLGGPQGAAGSPLRSVPPRDDPALPLSGGNLSPLLADPLPSLQGCNTRTHKPVTKQPHRVMKYTCAHKIHIPSHCSLCTRL